MHSQKVPQEKNHRIEDKGELELVNFSQQPITKPPLDTKSIPSSRSLPEINIKIQTNETFDRLKNYLKNLLPFSTEQSPLKKSPTVRKA